MFIREIIDETQITTRNIVYKIVSCSEYSEQDVLQMLQDKKARIFFDDQCEAPPCSFVSKPNPLYDPANPQVNAFIRIAEVYSGADQEKMTHTRDTVKKVTYSLFKS